MKALADRAEDELALKLLGRHRLCLFSLNGVVPLPLEHIHSAAFLVLTPVVGRADTGDVDDREAAVTDSLLNQADCLLDMIGASAGGVGSPCAVGQFGNVKRPVDVSVRGGRTELTGRRGRRILAAGHAVDVVVHDDHGQPYVSPGGMDQVVSADGGDVTVTGDDDDLQMGVGQLDSRGERDGPSVGRVDCVEVEIAGRPGRTADARNYDRVAPRQPQVLDCLGHVTHDDAVSASRAPDLGQMLRPHVLENQIRDLSGPGFHISLVYHHRSLPTVYAHEASACGSSSKSAAVISFGVIAFPLYLPRKSTLQRPPTTRWTSSSICP